MKAPAINRVDKLFLYSSLATLNPTLLTKDGLGLDKLWKPAAADLVTSGSI